jgi:hypothetical protein
MPGFTIWVLFVLNGFPFWYGYSGQTERCMCHEESSRIDFEKVIKYDLYIFEYSFYKFRQNAHKIT